MATMLDFDLDGKYINKKTYGLHFEDLNSRAISSPAMYKVVAIREACYFIQARGLKEVTIHSNSMSISYSATRKECPHRSSVLLLKISSSLLSDVIFLLLLLREMKTISLIV